MKKSIIINRERFIESVYHLHFYGNILNNIDYTSGDFSSMLTETQLKKLSFSIQWNILIITRSIIDELNKYLFNYNTDDLNLKKSIKAVKKIITPALNEINEWCGIKDFRNNVLAHNGRDYYGESVLLSSKFEKYNVPENHLDFLILSQLIKIITEKVAEIFSEELKEATKILDSLTIERKGRYYKIEDAVGKVNNIITKMNIIENNLNI